MLQLSTMDTLPVCLKGHKAMWSQRQDSVLILGSCISHRKSPKFSQCVWDRG